MTKIQSSPTNAFHDSLHADNGRWNRVYAQALGINRILMLNAPEAMAGMASSNAAAAEMSYTVCREAKGCLAIGLQPHALNGAARTGSHLWLANYSPEASPAARSANESLLSTLYAASSMHQMFSAMSSAGDVALALQVKARESLIEGQGLKLFIPTALRLMQKPKWGELDEVTVMLPDPVGRKLQPRSLLLSISQ